MKPFFENWWKYILQKLRSWRAKKEALLRLKQQDILKRKPNLKLCSNHFYDSILRRNDENQRLHKKSF